MDRPAVPPVASRAFLLLVSGHFLQACGYSSMLLLPLYLQDLGASRTEIGTVMAIAAVSGLVVRPATGWALDSLGRKPTLFAGTLFLAAGMALVALVDRIGPVVYLARVLFGIGAGTLFTGYFTFAADVIPIERRTEGLALFGISGLVPLLVNPIADVAGVAPRDLRWFLPATGGLILVSLLPIIPLREPRATHDRTKLSMAAVATALRQRPLWPVWTASLVFSGLVAVFQAFATVTAERRGVEHPAMLWLSYALGAVTIRAFGARLPDRVGPSNLVAPALGCYIAGSWLASRATTTTEFLVAALLAGIGHGCCFPVLASQVVSRSPNQFRGSAVSLFTAIWNAAELLGGPLFGAVADRHGDDGMFLLAAVTGLVSLVVWLGLEHRFGVPAPAAGP